jgi:hypothetical protein
MFLAICEGLGLAIAAGLILGVVIPPVMPDWGVLVGALPLGVIVAAAALNGSDEAVWPAIPIGLIGAGLAALVSRDVVAGASRREQDTLSGPAVQAPTGITVIVVVFAMLLAGLSLFIEPVSLVALAALSWLWLSRRRQEARKHEGLRVLR